MKSVLQAKISVYFLGGIVSPTQLGSHYVEVVILSVLNKGKRCRSNSDGEGEPPLVFKGSTAIGAKVDRVWMFAKKDL